MPFSRPSLSDLVTQIQSDFQSRLNLQGAPLRRSMVVVLSRVVAGATHLLYGFLEYLSQQLFADQSDSDYLDRQGSLFGVNPTPATFSAGPIICTGTDTSLIPEGSLLRRSDGVEFTTDADATISGTSVSVNVTAVLAAADGNTDAGVVLTFESPVTGVDGTATVDTDGLGGGTDPESLDAYRSRVLERLQNPPQGGSSADYEEWALQVAGVTRAWVYPQELGAGTVVIRFMRDNDSTPIPDGGEVADVQAYIQPLRPVTATVTTLAPAAVPLNFNLHVEPNTQVIKDAVTAELADLILREAAPAGAVPGAGIPTGALLISAIRTAIGTANGLTNYTLASPSTDVTVTAGQITTLGSITFT